MSILKLSKKLEIFKVTLSKLVEFKDIQEKYPGITFVEMKDGIYVTFSKNLTASKVRAILALYGIPFLENEKGIYIGKKQKKFSKKGIRQITRS